jgi:PAS domain S-box-containing protein
MARDVTAQRKLEQDYQTLFREMLDGCALHEIILDGQGQPVDYRFLAVNPAFERITGLKSEEVVGRTVLQVLPDTERHWIDTYGRVALTGVPTQFDNFSVELGKYFEVRAFRPAPGQFACIFVDVTERRRAAQERERLQSHLAQAQKMEAIGTLAGGVAHDFNNILGGLLGGLSLMEAELGDRRDLLRDVTEMKGLVDRGAELARQLLGFARRGKVLVKPQDLGRVVERTCTMFGRTRKDITIQVDLAPGLLAVLMDHAQLERVLLNLFLNAGVAMPGGGRLMVRAANHEVLVPSAGLDVKPGRFVELVVADTGVGMDSATQARVFEPFFTTGEPGQGTGLGLASVYGIVNGHGGATRVESALGQGTTFTLLLPAAEKAAWEPAVPPPPVHVGRGTVLVVDDEEHVLRVCARLLAMMGYEALTARGGKQALEVAREHGARISVVMLDLTMPEMSGSRTYDALREVLPHAKVLLSSGHGVEGQAQEILARGCHAFIQKPFDAAALSAKLQGLF